ncbi:MAG: hypothetical protein AAGE96_16390 [Cyanobacteria bacterium P01_G01_bin.19]
MVIHPNANSLSFAFWLQPVSLIWLVIVNDGSDTSSLFVTHGFSARRVARLGFQLPPFHPALRIDG